MASPTFPHRRYPKVFVTLGFLLSFFLLSCTPPPLPPELKLVEKLNQDLWKAQAQVYAPVEYQSYMTTLNKIRDDLRKQDAGFIWFRNYAPVAERLRASLKDGEEILTRVQERKEAKRANTVRRRSELEQKMKRLDGLSLTINEGRLVRRNLTKADLMIREAGFFLDRGDYKGAGSRLTRASNYIKASENILIPIFNRYTNKAQREKWKRWAEEVVAESRAEGVTVIVVSKMDRNLTIYEQGRPYKTYKIGIGRNGLADKLLSGDGATPEGRYRIVKKIPESRYHKALLLNYPNEEDRKEFLRLKKMGRIPKKAGMGGLIEIHGGGREGMTYGCISLEDRHMDEIFQWVTLGTPVAIVGSAF
jgi:L,D-peptidoglycan transpeptidase YkuD (ErfK/YbiS/YcfS/YnhG family)